MNYRHAYHAGNAADVLKHVVLLALVEKLCAKPKPWCFIDTHGGRGVYDLSAGKAEKTAEYRDGIGRVWGAAKLPALLQRWCALVAADPANAVGLRRYPGSPLLVAGQMRPGDQAQVCELQEPEAAALRTLFRDHAQVHVHQRDGYAALKALLPPAARRGLVLIDPAYEARLDEYRAIEAALTVALARWPTGIYAVWYPIKLEAEIRPWLRWAARVPVTRTLRIELMPYPPTSPLRLNGSGMMVFNAPWNLDDVLRESLAALARLLGQGTPAQWRLDWVRSDRGG